MQGMPPEYKITKFELSKTRITDADFKGLRIITITAYKNSKRVFQINWPEDERGDEPIQIGVCDTEIVNNRMVFKNTWLWELPSKKLIRQEFVNNAFVDKPDFQQREYPVDFKPKSGNPDETAGSWKVPNTFGMILDMEQGTLRFQIDHQVLDVAFKDDLKGKSLHLAFFGKKPHFKFTAWELIPKINVPEF